MIFPYQFMLQQEANKPLYLLFTMQSTNNTILHPKSLTQKSLPVFPTIKNYRWRSCTVLFFWLCSVYYLGRMDGTTPLTRLLPDTSVDTKGLFFKVIDEDGGVTALVASLLLQSEVVRLLGSGIISQMFSSILTTSPIEGLASVSSWQHLRARVTNFSTHSDGYEPILSSITENIVPD